MPTEPRDSLSDLRRLRQLERHGFLTAEEAEQLQAQLPPPQLREMLKRVRARHAEARLSGAVQSGPGGRSDAEALLERIRSGEHSKSLRSAVTALASAPTRGGHSAGVDRDASDPASESSAGEGSDGRSVTETDQDHQP